MEERFPRGLLLAIGAVTILILIIGAVGLWEQGGMALLPEDHLDKLEDMGEAGDRESPKDQPREPVRRPAPPTSTPPRQPSSVRVVATWETLGVASSRRDSATSRADSFHRVAPPFTLPEVRGRVRLNIDPRDGGVTGAVVIHGAPLDLTVRRAGAEDPGADAILEYEGRGRHARIIGLITPSGARVARFLVPRGLGAPESRWTLTAPGRMAGTVVDASSRQPVAGATVRVGRAITVTDSRGRFTLDPVRGREVVAYVTAPRFVPLRAVLETPDGFGSDRGPAFHPRLALRPGVQLTVEVRLPKEVKPPESGYRFYLIPFGHRIAMRDLAVEALGPLVPGPEGRLTVPGYPRGLEMCLVGVHPEMDLIYRRLRVATTDVEVPVRGRRRQVMQGTVRGESGKPVDGVRLETSLDGVTVGEYLGAARKIPTGLEAGNFPLPSLDLPLVTKRLDRGGHYRIAYDSSQRRTLALRFNAPGLEPRVVDSGRLTDRLDIDLKRRAEPVQEMAKIALTVVLMGSPEIERFESRGLEAEPGVVTRPGRIKAVIPRIPLGRYRLRIKADGYETYSRQLTFPVASKRTFEVFLRLE
jgi:hypothetical protein